MVMVKLIYL